MQQRRPQSQHGELCGTAVRASRISRRRVPNVQLPLAAFGRAVVTTRQQQAPCSALRSLVVAAAVSLADAAPAPDAAPHPYSFQSCMAEVMHQAAPGTTHQQKEAAAAALSQHCSAAHSTSWLLVECGLWLPELVGCQGPARAVLMVTPANTAGSSSSSRGGRPAVVAFKLDRYGLPTGERYNSATEFERRTSKAKSKKGSQSYMLVQGGRVTRRSLAQFLREPFGPDSNQIGQAAAAAPPADVAAASAASMAAQLAAASNKSSSRRRSSSAAADCSSVPGSAASTTSSSSSSAGPSSSLDASGDEASDDQGVMDTASSGSQRKAPKSAAKDAGMPATATTMVRSIWQNYFHPSGQQQQQQGEGQGVQDDDDVVADVVVAAAAAAAAAATSSGMGNRSTAASVSTSNSSNGSAGNNSAGLEVQQQDWPAVREVVWLDVASSSDAQGRQLHSKALVGSWQVEVGQVVLLEAQGTEGRTKQGGNSKAAKQQRLLGLVQCMWQNESGEKHTQVRLLVHGADTLLGDAAAEAELFVTDTYLDTSLCAVCGLVNAHHLVRAFDPSQRLAQFEEDRAPGARNAAAQAAGAPLSYVYRSLYLPGQGAFMSLPADLGGLGVYRSAPAAPVDLALLPGGAGFIKQGVEYRVGDFLYVQPGASGGYTAASQQGSDSSEGAPSPSWSSTDSIEGEAAKEQEDPVTISKASSVPPSTPTTPTASAKRRSIKGSIEGMRAWGVGRLVDVVELCHDSSSTGASSSRRARKAPSGLSLKLKLERFYRPEDISGDEAYQAGFWDIYAPPQPSSRADSTASSASTTTIRSSSTTTTISSSSSRSTDEPWEPWVQWVDASCVIKKCAARATGAAVPAGCDGLDCFDVRGNFNPTSRQLSGPPPEFYAPPEFAAAPAAAAAAAVGAVTHTEHVVHEQQEDPSSLALAIMDIFAGCGGLSEGLHQSGVAATRWAIEYEAPAAAAFKLNNPDAAVFCGNCNAILLAAMQKAGLEQDCFACDEAAAAASAMSPIDVAGLPLPGEVEFLAGGPPCQGYSGMNRHSLGAWSLVQNSMVMAYLSFADFYRPRYFLLENVRTFVCHNSSFTFRLTLRTLLDMGYQVRFGVLNAGHYGVPQSRNRIFIWAAAPDELLPEWPQPRHTFKSSQLTVNLPGGVSYCAVDGPKESGAPLRTVTVRDAIGDLPPIENGHDKDAMDYSGPPVSAFQHAMRARQPQVLHDHICKRMNPLNLERCRCIPKDTPGADWHVLQQIVAQDPSRELFNGQPLVPVSLPITAPRHNGWRGLFGRLDMDGYFPTSVTEPNPMGKVGQVFHPNQDRILSVREYARSQGFPDHYSFAGGVRHRHKQVGNAVPPPLAAALGNQLKAALRKRQQQKQQQQKQQQQKQLAGNQQQLGQEQEVAAEPAANAVC